MATLPGLAFDRRLLSAAFSAAIHIAVIAVLLLWHFSPAPRETKAAITVVDLPDRPPPDKPPPTPPPPEPHPTAGAAKAREAAPPAPTAEAAPLAKAIVPLTVPSFAPAPVPATGTQAAAGAGSSGTGTGAGGAGNGTGGGGNGGGGAGDGSGEGT
jgi:protein TonB